MARICVAGVGAVGTTIAARLTAAGETVSLLARGPRLAQLRLDGLRVDFGKESMAARPRAGDRPDFGIQDIVFIATKAQGLAELLPTLGPLIGPQTLVAPLVNGIPWWYFQKAGGAFEGDTVAAVDPRGMLLDSIAAERIIGCVVYFTAQLLPSGSVSVMGDQRLVVGEISHGASARADALSSLLSRAGITVKSSERIRDDLWTKVALNLATNPLSVVTEATLLDQFTDSKLLPIVRAVLEETARVALGHDARFTMSLDEMIATGRRAGPFETSMLQDYRAGRPLELDAIGASVLELAHKISQTMPTTRLIVDLCAHRAARRDALTRLELR
jgi:2-dehydropantoate 2-reductase